VFSVLFQWDKKLFVPVAISVVNVAVRRGFRVGGTLRASRAANIQRMTHTLTREELYALVWSEPIQKLAPRYGLSDRGFGKLCARYDIPVPPRGWWAKKAAGKRVKQDPRRRSRRGDRRQSFCSLV
jgi:hypothetical protein